MARKVVERPKLGNGKKKRKTSIGKSKNTAPKNKHKKRSFKKYRKQG